MGSVNTNESVCTAAKVVEKETQPPKPYTEGTLIAAMERAGKNLEGELKDVMKERGLGTPATRAAIIDRLKEVGYIENKEKQLVITDKGKQVIDMLRSIGLEVLTSAEWTGEWERRLNLIAQGKENHAAFMQEIISFVQHTVQQVQQANPNAIVSNSYLCPNCKEPLVERPLSFHCSNCAFVLWKNAFGKKLTDGALNALLIQHETEYMKFKSKNKKEYEAKVRIKNLQTGELELIFKNQIEKSVFCKCPKCNNGEVLDKGRLYGCSKYPICNFHLPKKLLKRELSGEEIKRLLEQKETGELDGFVSKNGKTFRANLKLNDDWKLAFEFENK